MNTNCRLINGRAVCPPVQFLTPRMRGQESDESLDISITALVLALLLLLGWIAKRMMRYCARVRRRNRGLGTVPKDSFEMEPRQGLNPQRPSAPPPPPQARSLPEPPPRAPPARSLVHPPPRAPAGGGGRYNLRSAKRPRTE
ncbi:uncharacterized protein LOC128172768 [Crassostrea angulata]|uniref:uncharacterized protein LOC128172768 n=1 Tax=Magallana angulata TaxID=2784310 RepID=UPI0022B1EEF5|nr:uncharacterized protein LOC128172768 [Crassostrea angulata]